MVFFFCVSKNVFLVEKWRRIFMLYVCVESDSISRADRLRRRAVPKSERHSLLCSVRTYREYLEIVRTSNTMQISFSNTTTTIQIIWLMIELTDLQHVRNTNRVSTHTTKRKNKILLIYSFDKFKTFEVFFFFFCRCSDQVPSNCWKFPRLTRRSYDNGS